MPWKKLSSKASRRADAPAIGIQKNKRISWNKGAQEWLERPQYVEVFIDEERGLLGLKKAELAEDTFLVRQAGKQQTWAIAAEGALNSVGIEVSQAHRKLAKKEDGVVFIEIKELLKGK